MLAVVLAFTGLVWFGLAVLGWVARVLRSAAMLAMDAEAGLAAWGVSVLEGIR